jgi:hypothetical protein
MLRYIGEIQADEAEEIYAHAAESDMQNYDQRVV